MENPQLLNVEEISRSESKIVCKGLLEGTKQQIFIKKALTPKEIQKNINNYKVLNDIKSVALAAALQIFGQGQNSILMPYYKKISIEYQIEQEKLLNLVEPILDTDSKFLIAYGVASAMKSSHEKRILHLNLKPSNILLDDSLLPKISDFLNQNSFTREEISTMPINKLMYMAPEVLQLNKASIKADVFSFGLLLHFLYTGKNPIENIQDQEQIRSILIKNSNIQYSFDPNEYIDQPEIVDIIEKCISLDPDRRPTFDEIVINLHQLAFQSNNQLFGNYYQALISKSAKLT